MIPSEEWIITQEIPRLAIGGHVYSVPLETIGFNTNMERLADKGKCVLILARHPSDAWLTDKLLAQVPENIIHIIANNVYHPNPRVSPMPIGIPMDAAKGMKRLFAEPGAIAKANKVLVCHRTPPPQWAHHLPRQAAYDYFSGKEWATVLGETPSDEWQRQLLSHRFMVSPPGSGWDCDRTWQAVYSGTYPIVLDSSFTRLLCQLDLPLIKVPRWDVVNMDMLNAWAKDRESKVHVTVDASMLSYWKAEVAHWRGLCQNL